tara:strand:- start:497 stop:1393 length:897 start_codon:yes stop_codon:yes gene_type:complete
MSDIQNICKKYNSTEPMSRKEERLVFSRYRYLFDRQSLLEIEDPEHAKIQKQIERLQSKVVSANIRFVCMLARPFSLGYKVEMQDVVAEGVVGIVRAMSKFSVDQETKFITYAVFWIRNCIERAMQNSNTIRVNYAVLRNLDTYKKNRRKLEQEQERNMSLREAVSLDDDIKTKPTWDPETWDLLESNISSLDKRVFDDEDDGISLVSNIEDKNVSDPIDACAEDDNVVMVNDLMTKALDFREQQCVEWFYGLNGHTPRTCEVIAKDMNFSRQRVSQIIDLAERKMRYQAMINKRHLN